METFARLLLVAVFIIFFSSARAGWSADRCALLAEAAGATAQGRDMNEEVLSWMMLNAFGDRVTKNEYDWLALILAYSYDHPGLTHEEIQAFAHRDCSRFVEGVSS